MIISLITIWYLIGFLSTIYCFKNTRGREITGKRLIMTIFWYAPFGVVSLLVLIMDVDNPECLINKEMF